MKKIFLIIIILIAVLACTTSKQIVRPQVKLEFLDSTTKEKLKGITVFVTTQNDSLNLYLKKIGTSNEKGIAIIPKLKVDLGNHAPTMPVNRVKCVFKSDTYKYSELVLFDYFEINKMNALNERYDTKIILYKK